MLHTKTKVIGPSVTESSIIDYFTKAILVMEMDNIVILRLLRRKDANAVGLQIRLQSSMSYLG